MSAVLQDLLIRLDDLSDPRIEAFMQEASARGFARVSLETGTQPFFEPARPLYLQNGFVECGPFADYCLDPFSFFMTRTL